MDGSREREVPLLGGWTHESVARIGDTVHRPLGPNSMFVHELLLHLERVRFDGAPRFFGIDDQGREVLSFMAGESVPGTAILRDDEIVSAAQLLRRYHDAASTLTTLSPEAETV